MNTPTEVFQFLMNDIVYAIVTFVILWVFITLLKG